MDTEDYMEEEKKSENNVFLEVVVTAFLAIVFLFFFVKFLFF